MSYFEDSTEYQYENREKDGSVNIGWLDINHSYATGEVTTEFIDKLWIYLSFPINIYRGFHSCELCKKSTNDSVPTVFYKGEQREVGFHEIRVFSHNKKVYAAPTLIFHYIVEHQYKPPDEFIDAVLDGPEPGSAEYMELIEPFCTHVNKEVWWNIK